MKILILVLAIAAIMDMLRYRIPNICIAAGMASGIFLAGQQGAQVLAAALVQTMAVFAVFYPFYLLGGLGAGDVKLFMLLGCYLDKRELISCIAAAMLLAGAVAVCRLIGSAQCRQHVRAVFYYLRKIIRTGAVNDEMPVRTKTSAVRLAAPVLCSTLLCAGGVL